MTVDYCNGVHKVSNQRSYMIISIISHHANLPIRVFVFESQRHVHNMIFSHITQIVYNVIYIKQLVTILGIIIMLYSLFSKLQFVIYALWLLNQRHVTYLQPQG